MRDFLNAILLLIDASFLTDEEYDSIDVFAYGLNVETFNVLLTILDARELVSNTRDRLKYYFLSRGVEVELTSAATSNIFIGAVLE